MNNKIIPAVQAVISLVLIGAVKLWAPVCPKLLDLANGNQTHMKCWFSATAVACLAVVVFALAIAELFMDKASRKKVQLVVIVAAILMFLVFSTIIGICMAPEMACHKTFLWVKICAGSLVVLSLVDIFTGKDKQVA